MTSAPVLFISHGAPSFALEPGRLGAQLKLLGGKLSGITAVLVVSPHWQTSDVRVMSAAAPATLHDFGGFDPALYELQYPAPGHPQMAAETARLLALAGFPVTVDAQRKFDHGAWVPLLHLLPQANLPVFQVSMPHTLDTHGALRLGRALAPLRQQGVLILGSGSITHNLYELQAPGSAAAVYVDEFSAWVRDVVLRNDLESLAGYRHLAPHAERAHPTEEHFLPLLVAVGAHTDAEAGQVFGGDVTYGVIGTESYAWGLQ